MYLHPLNKSPFISLSPLHLRQHSAILPNAQIPSPTRRLQQRWLYPQQTPRIWRGRRWLRRTTATTGIILLTDPLVLPPSRLGQKFVKNLFKFVTRRFDLPLYFSSVISRAATEVAVITTIITREAMGAVITITRQVPLNKITEFVDKSSLLCVCEHFQYYIYVLYFCRAAVMAVEAVVITRAVVTAIIITRWVAFTKINIIS